LHIETPFPVIQDASSALVTSLLSQSILFEHDPQEIELWLAALPRTRRPSKPNVPLSDEGDGILAFLDDCIQRCLKTPYRYLEECRSLLSAAPTQDMMDTGEPPAYTIRPLDMPSSLIMTFLEQLKAKATSAKPLSPSDVLALATYFRKLAISLLCKQPNIQHALQISNCFGETLRAIGKSDEYSEISRGVVREAQLLRDALEYLVNPTIRTEVEHSSSRASMDHLVGPLSDIDGHTAASALLDWLRLNDPPLSSVDVSHLFRIAKHASVDSESVREILFQLNPKQGSIWAIEDLDNSAGIRCRTSQASI
jgi:nucleolar pre-ribosomal-associated protein 1